MAITAFYSEGKIIVNDSLPDSAWLKTAYEMLEVHRQRKNSAMESDNDLDN